MGVYADNTAVAFNEYLQVWLELGILGLIITSLTIIYLFTIKSGKNNQRATDSLKGSFLTICILSLFSYPFQDLNSAIYALICIGLLCSNDTRVLFTIRFAWSRWTLSLLIIMETFILFYFLNSCIEITKSYKKWNQLTIDINLSDDMIINKYALVYKTLKKDGLFLYNYAAILSKNKNYNKSNNLLKETLFYFNDVNIWTIKGDNYVGLEKYAQAERCYLYAYKMVPNRFYPLYKLMKLYKLSNQDAKVRMLAKIIINKKAKIPSIFIESLKQEAKNDLQHPK